MRRKLGAPDEESWQMYGLAGELLAEYNVQYLYLSRHWVTEVNLSKEYGYRNSQLLVIASAPPPCPDPRVFPPVESGGVQWLVTDQLGTPRMIFDKTGSLANVKRHDYLPFGEELTAGQGSRSTNLQAISVANFHSLIYVLDPKRRWTRTPTQLHQMKT